MPAKLTTITYVHSVMERLSNNYTIKEITGVTYLDDDDPTKVIYLKIKAFIPVDREVETHVGEFETGQVVHSGGKFVACGSWYTVIIYDILLIWFGFSRKKNPECLINKPLHFVIKRSAIKVNATSINSISSLDLQTMPTVGVSVVVQSSLRTIRTHRVDL